MPQHLHLAQREDDCSTSIVTCPTAANNMELGPVLHQQILVVAII
jgi:hypothetical protein